jgi:hydroxyacyl-ACP dehydratase HTD2-like protein with hotdog domain
MSPQPYFEDVSEGDELVAQFVTVSAAQLFFFSAATYNGHLIHFSEAWATGVEGHPGIVIHGPLQVALSLRMVTEWIGPRGRLVTYSVQSRGTAYLGDTLRLGASVTAKVGDAEADSGLVNLTLRVTKNDDELLVPGTATVTLPMRSRLLSLVEAGD